MSIRRAPTDEEIAARAREIWEQRGGRPRDERACWREAKAELEAAEAAAESDDRPPIDDRDDRDAGR
jgi:hypothetical protein